MLRHPGGPFWARKDDGAWSIPKGEYTEGEDPWTVAQREFAEELGKTPPDGPRNDLDAVKQPGGKVVTAFAVRGDLTSTERSATRSRWSGRRAPGTSGSIRKSTAPVGFPSLRRGPSC